MIIQAELKCKQTGCEADPCAVDKMCIRDRFSEYYSSLFSQSVGFFHYSQNFMTS